MYKLGSYLLAQGWSLVRIALKSLPETVSKMSHHPGTVVEMIRSGDYTLPVDSHLLEAKVP